jgi:tRNA/tmRNA/rRNA uracil-C5-methylase (TrmA/RlmC/RlmD family)
VGANWAGSAVEVTLGKPGHGGICVARHEGRVILVRHGLPGERVRVLITEDTGGSYCRGDVVDVLEGAAGRVARRCPIAGPGGAGCCDLSHATLPAQREFKAHVVREQLSRIADVAWNGEVAELPGTGDGTGWRTRVRLGVGADGAAGFRRHRSAEFAPGLRCPQVVAGALNGIAQRSWSPGTELQVVVDDAGARHIVQVAPADRPRQSDRRRPGAMRTSAQARRAAASRPRPETVVEGTGRALQRVGAREWTLSPTAFWQAHRGAAHAYSDVVRDWALAEPGDVAWDLYGGVGVFGSVLGDLVTERGVVETVELSSQAAAEGAVALADLPQVRFHTARVERAIPTLAPNPGVVVIDPPRAGAGREVVAALAAAGPRQVIHIGCDPAAFARDIGLYREHGFELEQVRAFDAFPMTHHVECAALLVRPTGR